MSKRVVFATAATMLGALALHAGTYTWTGNGNDGLWFTAGNWNYEGAAATTSPDHALQVNSLRINGTELRSGRYTAAELPAIVQGSGYVEVAAQRTVIYLR